MALPGEAFVAAAGALAVGLVLKFGRPDEEEPPTPTPIRPKPMNPVPTIYQNMLAKQNLIVPENNLILPQQQGPSWKVGLNQDFVNQVGSSPQDYLNPQRDMPLATKFLQAVTSGTGIPPIYPTKTRFQWIERVVYDSSTKSLRTLKDYHWSPSFTPLAYHVYARGFSAVPAEPETPQVGRKSSPRVVNYGYPTSEHFRIATLKSEQLFWDYPYNGTTSWHQRTAHDGYLAFAIMNPYDTMTSVGGFPIDEAGNGHFLPRKFFTIWGEGGLPMTHFRRNYMTARNGEPIVEPWQSPANSLRGRFEVQTVVPTMPEDYERDAVQFEFASDLGNQLKIVLGSVFYEYRHDARDLGLTSYSSLLHSEPSDTVETALSIAVPGEVGHWRENDWDWEESVKTYGPESWTIHRLKPDNEKIPKNLLDQFYASARGRDNVLGRENPEWIALERKLRNVQQGLNPDGSYEPGRPVEIYGVRLYHQNS